MKKSILILGIIVVVIVLAFWLISAKMSGTTNETHLSQLSESTSKEVQNATLSYSNSGYVLTPSTLKGGVPVKITVDTTKLMVALETL